MADHSIQERAFTQADALHLCDYLEYLPSDNTCLRRPLEQHFDTKEIITMDEFSDIIRDSPVSYVIGMFDKIRELASDHEATVDMLIARTELARKKKKVEIEKSQIDYLQKKIARHREVIEKLDEDIYDLIERAQIGGQGTSIGSDY